MTAALLALALLANGGQHWRAETEAGPLHAWAPADARPGEVVVYVHGYGAGADEVWTRHRLAAQFEASGRAALFLVPEAPRGPREGVRWRSLGDLLDAARRAGAPVPRGGVTLVGHSGGYRSLAAWLDDPRVGEIVLLDALYGHEAAFRRFLERGGRLVVVSRGTARRATALLRGRPEVVARPQVPATVDDLPRARVFHFFSQYGHAEIVESGRVLPVVLRLGVE